MSEEYVLELEHIRKEYPGVVALKDVTLQLRKGEVLGLIGENGAGKSTLIKCCSGAVIPTSGKIKVNGKEFDRMTPQLADPAYPAKGIIGFEGSDEDTANACASMFALILGDALENQNVFRGVAPITLDNVDAISAGMK